MKQRSAFTLIELLVVVLIIGILAAVAVPQYTKAVRKARLGEMQSMLSSLEKAAIEWMLTNPFPEEYTNITEQLSIDFGWPLSGPNGYCNFQKKMCVYVQTVDQYISVRVGSFDIVGNADGDLDYVLASSLERDGTKERFYEHCNADLSNYGLEDLGFEDNGC